MRSLRDTFLHFLADNLTDVPVHNIRRDKNDPGAGTPQNNAVNVEFLDTQPSTQIGRCVVCIDIINDNELDAVDWAESVFNVLGAAFMTPQLDYTDPANPVRTGTNLYWSREGVKFIPIPSDFYYRLSARLTVYFH